MKTVTKTAEYTIYQKKSGRYAVIGANKAYINGDDKARILLEAGLVKVAVAPKEEPVEDAVEESAPETVEASAEEKAAEAPAEEPKE